MRKYLVFVTCLLLMLWLFPTTSSSEEAETFTIPTQRAGWFTLPDHFWADKHPKNIVFRNKEAKFAIEMPAGTNLRSRSPGKFPYIKVQVTIMPETTLADGPCGTADRNSFFRQKKLLNDAKSEKDSVDAIEVTEYGTAFARLRTTGNLKIAYGIQNCQADAEDQEPVVTLDWAHAIFFTGDYRVQLSFEAIPVDKGVTYSSSKQYLQKVQAGGSGTETEAIWKAFEKIVQSIKSI